MKRYGVFSPILGKIDFHNLYNIYGIDLSSQDPVYLNKNTSLQLTKSQNSKLYSLSVCINKSRKAYNY